MLEPAGPWPVTGEPSFGSVLQPDAFIKNWGPLFCPQTLPSHRRLPRSPSESHAPTGRTMLAWR